MGQDRGAQVVRACAVEMHLDVAQEALCSNLQEECQSPEPGTRLCASPRCRNAFGDFTRTVCARIYRWNAADQNRDPHFVRACAVEMHLDVSQEPFLQYWKFTGKMPEPRWSTLGTLFVFFLMYIFICTRIFPSTYPTYLPLFKKCWSTETMHLLPSLPGGRSLGAKRKARGCGHGGCHKATGQRMWWGPVILRLPFQVN